MNKEIQENQQLLEGNLRPSAARYLTIYLGDPSVKDWDYHIDDLARSFYNKVDDISGFMREAVSCAILLPRYDTVFNKQPEQVLSGCPYWKQFKQRDWFELLKKVAEEDITIVDGRSELLSLGVIKHLAWHTKTRQASNWLLSLAKDMGDLNEENFEDVKRRVHNLIYVYGGTTICDVYERMTRMEDKKKILNMRTCYFFEKYIHSHYKHEDLVKIKQKELVKAGDKLVKSVKI